MTPDRFAEITGRYSQLRIAVVGDGALTGGMTWEALEAMAETGMVLQVHGEVTSADVDVFDREREGGRYEIAGLFGVSSTPSTFLVGADGTVRAAWSGEVDEATLAASIGVHLAAARGGGDGAAR